MSHMPLVDVSICSIFVINLMYNYIYDNDDIFYKMVGITSVHH